MRPGLAPFLLAVMIALVLAVWSSVGDPPSGAPLIGLFMVIALLAMAEWRR